jgi:DegV family protein with EDD domain
MSIEKQVVVIADSGCSIRPDSLLAQEKNIQIAPQEVKFFENGQWVTYEDTDEHLSLADFYQKMRTNPRLPQTSGAIPGKLRHLYDVYAQNEQPMISIHLGSHMSTAWESAILASKLALEKHPHLLLDVIDSEQVSTGTWFLVEQAADLAQQGYPLEDIKQITLETIPKINLCTALSTFENVVKGGRLSSAASYLGSKLQIRPLADMADGQAKLKGITRTNNSAQKELFKRVENTSEEIVKLAVMHTNFPEGAAALQESLATIYHGNISIYEAGPIMGVHVGEKSLGIVFQKV